MKQTFRNLQHFSFVLAFLLLSFTVLWSASGELVTRRPCAHDWMLCNALGQAPGGVRICCTKFGCPVVAAEKQMLHSGDF